MGAWDSLVLVLVLEEAVSRQPSAISQTAFGARERGSTGAISPVKIKTRRIFLKPRRARPLRQHGEARGGAGAA
jgi:hypothetical protein